MSGDDFRDNTIVLFLIIETTMTTESITENEVLNDGKTIHLYFNGLIGLYTAYGISSFLLSKETTVSPSYSESLQMPVVMVNSSHLNELKKRLTVVYEGKGYCCMVMADPIDDDQYEEWASQLRM